MKKSLGILLALGLGAPLAMAQNQPPSQPMTVPPGTPAQSDLGMPPQPSITSPSTSGTSGSARTTEESSGSTSAPSGASSESGSTPVNHNDSTDLSSGGSSQMQSEAGAELQPAPPLADRLQPVVQGDVTYVCGGVGAEEASSMKRQAKNYDLMLTFAAKSGAYLADVNVDIKDPKGNSVLQASCDAPMMLIDLPHSGNYKVHADAAGYKLDRTVRVAAAKRKGQHVASAVLVWPQQVAEAQGTAATSTGSSGNAGESAGGRGTGSTDSKR
ncbi:MAG TPA: hypothetical protein VJ698_11090 [Noviherbaspirillum sp.]|uniref:hypothetical protein n=1 Tax=Noviherbaspirillum sp. TaxID=1926288 RepID=UPI002B48C806|nr:hypothetical protein [Noviherbaspirillum sp.]HJV86008.1 hypothetical protein [Noviherbaspirillum sp.]